MTAPIRTLSAIRAESKSRLRLHFPYTFGPAYHRVMAVGSGVVWAIGVGAHVPPATELLKSTDGGATYTSVIDFGKGIRVVHVTPQGSVLVGVGDQWDTLEICELHRSTDGATFTKIMDFVDGGLVWWNIDSDPEGYVFCSEYGTKAYPNNARKIYRSTNDGATFSMIYDPDPVENYHNHGILIDPYDYNVIYQSIGDAGNRTILKSTDRGNTWTAPVGLVGYQPTSGVVFKDYILWAKEVSPMGALKHDKTTDTVTQCLEVAGVGSPYFTMMARNVAYIAFPATGDYGTAQLYMTRDVGGTWSLVKEWEQPYVGSGRSLGNLVQYDDDYGFVFHGAPTEYYGSIKFKLFA